MTITWPPPEFELGLGNNLQWKEVQFHSLNFTFDNNFYDKIKALYGLATKVELQSVIQNLRKACIHALPLNELSAFKGAHPQLYYYVQSYIKKQPIGFSHTSENTTPDDPNAEARVLISNEPIPESKAFSRDNKVIGELLGYPDCCTDFFVKWWFSKDTCCHTHYDLPWHADGEIISTKDLTYGKEITKKMDGFYQCNPFLRYLPIRLISYQPCSMKCEKSRQFSDNIYKPLIPEEQYNFIKEQLSQPMEWNRLHGIAIVATPKFWVFNHSDYTMDKQVVRINGYSFKHKYGQVVQNIINKKNINVAK